MEIVTFINQYTAGKNADLPENPAPLPFGLPNFQRQFKWNLNDIEKLFDSIFQKLPLPLLFSWEIQADTTIAASKFLDSFNGAPNEPFSNGNYGIHTKLICDGQQRLTSIIIGILGLPIKGKRLYFISDSFTYENGHYMPDNIFKFKSVQGNGPCGLSYYTVNDYFSFYSTNRILSNYQKATMWINQKYPTIDLDIVDHSIKNHIFGVTQSIFELFEYVLPFKDITAAINNRPDLALEFFIRINEGGKKLDKASLIFSILSGKLEQSDLPVRENFTEIINDFRHYLKFDFEYLVRCLIYLHFEELIWKPSVFQDADVTQIIQKWDMIEESIRKGLQIVVDFNLAGEINSINSIIPIMNFFYNTQKSIAEISNDEKLEILKYFVASQYSGVWSQHGDTLLKHIKRRQNILHNNPLMNNFNCNDLVNDEYMPRNMFGLRDKSFTVPTLALTNIFEKEDFVTRNKGYALALVNLGQITVNESLQRIIADNPALPNQIRIEFNKLANYFSYTGELPIAPFNFDENADLNLEERKNMLIDNLSSALNFTTDIQ